MSLTRTPWRDNIEAMTMAIVMALLLKCFIVEAYKIPTGSMQPTLIGDETSGIKDRILVDKLSYAFEEPARWDVAVFQYPLNRAQNFVKRIVGVGPEELMIENGDIWRRDTGSDPWEIVRRPEAVQASAWKELDVDAPEEPSWNSANGNRQWTFEGRSIVARGEGIAKFRRDRSSIVDAYLDGYPEELIPWMAARPRGGGRHGFNPVGDIRVDGTIEALDETESVTIELSEGLRRYRFELPGPAAHADARASIQWRSLGQWTDDSDGLPRRIESEDASSRLPANRAIRFAVQNLDDLLRLELGGEIVASLEIDAAHDQSAGARIEVRGSGARLDDLMVYRDIYYLSEGRWRVTIPEAHYYMLGDNTQDSSDSREWRLERYLVPGPAPTGSIETDEDGRWIVRGNSRGPENPRTVGYGDADGPKLVFQDEFGETRWFLASEAERLSPIDAPFVPRSRIQGRALAVFWPINPMKGIFRLKWVH